MPSIGSRLRALRAWRLIGLCRGVHRGLTVALFGCVLAGGGTLVGITPGDAAVSLGWAPSIVATLVSERAADDPRVLAALDRAAAAELPAALPHALDTQLGHDFAGGVDLSQGEWQKVALGRAMMRTTPLLVILDEPTASLDAPTEHALFERFAGAARRTAAGAGAITLLISHRFSTVRMADLILVMSGGKIAERGDHAALIRAGGLYAELYELQRRAYR